MNYANIETNERRSQHSPSSIKVTLGDYILNSDIESIPHEVFSVVEVLLHPNFRFTPQADRYDVAVLELDRQANYKDNIKPICLPQKDATFVGRVSYVAGWGALQAGESTATGHLGREVARLGERVQGSVLAAADQSRRCHTS